MRRRLWAGPAAPSSSRSGALKGSSWAPPALQLALALPRSPAVSLPGGAVFQHERRRSAVCAQPARPAVAYRLGTGAHQWVVERGSP